MLYNCFVCVEWGERREIHLKCSRVNILKNKMARSVKYGLADNMGQSKNATVPSQSDAPEESDL